MRVGTIPLQIRPKSNRSTTLYKTSSINHIFLLLYANFYTDSKAQDFEISQKILKLRCEWSRVGRSFIGRIRPR